MEIYENENDQVEAVKRFFAENGKALAVGVILGVGALIGCATGTAIRLILHAPLLLPIKMRLPQ